MNSSDRKTRQDRRSWLRRPGLSGQIGRWRQLPRKLAVFDGILSAIQIIAHIVLACGLCQAGRLLPRVRVAPIAPALTSRRLIAKASIIHLAGLHAQFLQIDAAVSRIEKGKLDFIQAQRDFLANDDSFARGAFQCGELCPLLIKHIDAHIRAHS